MNEQAIRKRGKVECGYVNWWRRRGKKTRLNWMHLGVGKREV